MSVAIEDGVLGLEATHTFYPWGGAAAYLLNGQAAWPRARLDKITGLHSLGEAEDNREQAYGRIGEIPRVALPRGRTLVYTGRFQGHSAQTLRRTTAAARAAFSSRTFEGSMVVSPDPAYGGLSWAYSARVMQLDADDEQTRPKTARPTPWQREFILGLRQSDPRYYLADGGHVWNDDDGVTVANPGSAPADPLVVVGGVAAGQTVTIARTGGYQLVFNSLPAGDLYVNFANRTAECAAVNALGHLDPATSNWWDEIVEGIPAGFAGDVWRAGGGSSIQVSYYYASW